LVVDGRGGAQASSIIAESALSAEELARRASQDRQARRRNLRLITMGGAIPIGFVKKSV
jgi:hypothetical protein